MMSSLFSRWRCLNRSCGVGLELSEKRNGWRLRSGELAPLCDRCASAYAEGRFCDTFHSHESGWRCCDSCGKRVHCGCIISLHAFVMLDIGGIRCCTCETKWPYSSNRITSPFDGSADPGVCNVPECLKTACGPVKSSVISCSQSEKSLQASLSGETQTNVAFFQANACFQKQVLPGYCPEMSNERRVSANDASRVGRLVLPKKCAENYFPPVSLPEGLPLQVRDEKGNDWSFRFRFWTNNNIWKLQAGDVVTFSRLEPEGKLIIGFRKASNTLRSGQSAPAEQSSSLVKVDNGRCIAAREGSVHSKRKNNMSGSTHKKIKVDNVDMITVTVTMEEAQALLRPASGNVPRVVIVEEFEIEEYE
ncbi:B3 domain-containing transcription repressor VAL2-like protein, partial [Drosera capensis]